MNFRHRFKLGLKGGFGSGWLPREWKRRITKRLSSISRSKLLNHSLGYHLPSSDTVVKKEIKNEIELVEKGRWHSELHTTYNPSLRKQALFTPQAFRNKQSTERNNNKFLNRWKGTDFSSHERSHDKLPVATGNVILYLLYCQVMYDLWVANRKLTFLLVSDCNVMRWGWGKE